MICGGGVIGAAVAYYLAKRGVRGLIVEAEGIASGASGAAAGILTPPMLPDPRDPLGAMLRAGFDLHLELARTLPQESGLDYAFARTPRLWLAVSEAEERHGRRVAQTLRAAGAEGRWLTPPQVHDLCDWIDRPIRGALLGELAAQLDPHRFTHALIAAAERLGASTLTGRVTGLDRKGERLTGVRVDGRLIPTDTAVIAMGPWSSEAAAWLGSPVPVEPLKGQIVRVRPPHDLAPCGFSDANDDYAVPKLGGLVYLGTTEERVGFDVTPTAAARDRILRFGARFASVLEGAEVVEQTACLRPLSRDGLPIMGPAPGLAGAYVATGHGRKGLMLAPASGRALAELVVAGRASSIDLTAFAPGRFQNA